MSKEKVYTNLDGTTNVMPYRSYYEQRNTGVAKIVADKLGLPLVVGEPRGDDLYHVMAKVVSKKMAKELGINNSEDFYGVAVEHPQQVEKSVLYPVVGEAAGYHSEIFPREIRDAVLEGYSFFSQEGAVEAYQRLNSDRSLRLKLLPNSDGNGQFKVKSETELCQILSQANKEDLTVFGAVLEPNLFEAETVSVGEIRIGASVYSFLAFQKGDVAPEDGRNRYMGADLLVVRGMMDKLLRLDQSEPVEKQVRQAITFHRAYSFFEPITSRISYDVLFGYDDQGRYQSGVTDITARLGGSCPAVMLGVKALDEDQAVTAVRAEVDLDYEPNQIEPGSVVFINHPSLTIQAKVTELVKGGG